jgi:hypothetical protein
MSAQNETYGDHLNCKRCGNVFTCRADQIEKCHCSTVKLHPATLAFLNQTEWGCLCSDCLREIDHNVTSSSGEQLPAASKLKEGIHYYVENGLFVFTEYYHLLRGYCCKNGCRHCAYGFKKEKI